MTWDIGGEGDWFPPPENDDDWGELFDDGGIDDTGFPDFNYWDDYTSGLQDWLAGMDEAAQEAMRALDDAAAAAFKEWTDSIPDVVGDLLAGYRRLGDVDNRDDLRGPFAKPGDAQAIADSIPAPTEIIYDDWSDLWYVLVHKSP